MSEKKKIAELPAEEFMARHMQELDESEEAISMKLLASMGPQAMNSLEWLVTPSPKRDAWLRAHAAPGYRLMRPIETVLACPITQSRHKGK